MLLAIPFGLAIGIAVGMLGGGGSVLAVPVLVYVLGQSVSDATTASLAIITATSSIGLGVHLLAGRSLDLEITAAMAGHALSARSPAPDSPHT